MVVQTISIPNGLAVHSVNCGDNEIVIVYDDKPKNIVVKGFRNE